MKTVKANSMKDFEYRAERDQVKKQTKLLRNQRRGKTNRWVIAD